MRGEVELDIGQPQEVAAQQAHDSSVIAANGSMHVGSSRNIHGEAFHMGGAKGEVGDIGAQHFNLTAHARQLVTRIVSL